MTFSDRRPISVELGIFKEISMVAFTQIEK